MVLRARIATRLPLLLFLIGRILLQIFDDIDDADVLGDVFLHSLADDDLAAALGAEEDLAVGLDAQSIADAFFAVGVSALGYDAGSAVVNVEVEFAEWADWG
jgi:hypothetical protein